MRGFFFTTCTLRQHFCASVFGAVKSQTTALDKHPAADDVINHQQQEPDSNRRLQAGQQRLCCGQVTYRGRKNGNQRGAHQHIPQHAVDHVVAVTLFVEVQRNTGALQAQGDDGQCATDQHKAQATQ